MKKAIIARVDDMAKPYVALCPANVDTMLRDADEYLLMRRRRRIKAAIQLLKDFVAYFRIIRSGGDL